MQSETEDGDALSLDDSRGEAAPCRTSSSTSEAGSRETLANLFDCTNKYTLIIFLYFHKLTFASVKLENFIHPLESLPLYITTDFSLSSTNVRTIRMNTENLVTHVTRSRPSVRRLNCIEAASSSNIYMM